MQSRQTPAIAREMRGFSLVELLTTVTVGAVLLGIAVPSFVDLTTRNRITTYTNGFVGTLNYARAEAIRRRTTISVCATTNGNTCTTTAGNWSGGWIVFVNTDNDSPAVIDVGETVLKKSPGLATNYSLGTGDFATHVTFNADGSVPTAGKFAICHAGSIAGARTIVLTRMRPRLGVDTDGNGIPNTDGGDISSCAAP